MLKGKVMQFICQNDEIKEKDLSDLSPENTTFP